MQRRLYWTNKDKVQPINTAWIFTRLFDLSFFSLYMENFTMTTTATNDTSTTIGMLRTCLNKNALTNTNENGHVPQDFFHVSDFHNSGQKFQLGLKIIRVICFVLFLCGGRLIQFSLFIHSTFLSHANHHGIQVQLDMLTCWDLFMHPRFGTVNSLAL